MTALRRLAPVAAGLVAVLVLVAVVTAADRVAHAATSPILPNPQHLPAFHTADPSPVLPVELAPAPLPRDWTPAVARAMRLRSNSAPRENR